MTPISPLAVISTGMVTAVGFNAAATCAGLRAGVSGVRKADIYDPTGGSYMGAARPLLPQWWEGAEALAELAAPALLECIAGSAGNCDVRDIRLVLLLSPEDRPCRDADLTEILPMEMLRRLPFEPRHELVVFARGSVGLLLAAQYASRTLESGDARYVAVIGVDSFVRQVLVEHYMEGRRILTADNSNGFIPGEAACAVLLGLPPHRGARMIVRGYGAGNESGTITSETSLTGDGLTTALRAALDQAGLVMADTHYWLTDQNGEHYKALECTIAQIRLERRDTPAALPYEIWHPIEYVGEIGSAIGPCLLGVALAAHRGGYAPGPLALMHVGEDGGERAAFVIDWKAE